MKPTVAIAVAVLAVLAESSPVGQLAKRSTTCALTGSDVRYHVAPSVKSSAPGQFGAKGTKVAFTCWTEGINGDSEYVPSLKKMRGADRAQRLGARHQRLLRRLQIHLFRMLRYVAKRAFLDGGLDRLTMIANIQTYC